MLAFVDHAIGGSGEALAAMLRLGKVTANDAADQIAVLDIALAQLPGGPCASPSQQCLPSECDGWFCGGCGDLDLPRTTQKENVCEL